MQVFSKDSIDFSSTESSIDSSIVTLRKRIQKSRNTINSKSGLLRSQSVPAYQVSQTKTHQVQAYLKSLKTEPPQSPEFSKMFENRVKYTVKNENSETECAILDRNFGNPSTAFSNGSDDEGTTDKEELVQAYNYCNETVVSYDSNFQPPPKFEDSPGSESTESFVDRSRSYYKSLKNVSVKNMEVVEKSSCVMM